MEDLLIWVGLAILAIATFLHFRKSNPSPDTLKATKSNGEQEKTKIVVAKKQSDITYGKIFLFYGSQSGTANKFSVILGEEATANDFDASVENLKDFTPEFFTQGNNLCVFCMATQGEGEATDNAVGFYNWLKEQTDPTLLKNTRYTVFGLGNTQYEHYNFMGRETNKHFDRLGAKRIYKYGEGDDNSSLEDDFNAWKADLWTELKKVVPAVSLNASEVKPKKKSGSAAFSLRKTEKAEVDLVNDGKTKYEFMTNTYLNGTYAMIRSIQEIRQNNADGSTLHVEINLKNAQLKYKTAQNLGVFADNDPTLVCKVADYLKLDLNERYEIEVEPEQQEKFKHPFPSPISVRTILTKFCDFQGQLMKKTLKDLAKLTENEESKSKLEKLASASGKKEFDVDITGKQRTIFDLLKEYGIVPSLEQFVDLCPRLSPRLFTISSSDLASPEVVTITDSLVADVLEDGTVKHGICSKFLTNMQNRFANGITQNRIRIDFRPSSFVLPATPKTPVIMVGPGTGVAPFIAFCQEKEVLLEKGINIAPGEFTLYFGCRHQDGDFIFKDQLQNFVSKNVLNKLYTAFSRDQGSKVYVQDLLRKNEDEFYEQFIEKNGVLYICGATSMGNSVVQAVSEIVQKKQGISAQEAQKVVESLDKSKRIIKELW